MHTAEDYKKFQVGSTEIIERLVEDHKGWATAIAKSVARAWNLDWEMDGLDGGAFEGLLFCARRYDPSMGIPFRAYARRRIHEASTEEARKSKRWQRGTSANGSVDDESREISAKLFDVFPSLRDGVLPASFTEGAEEESIRSSIRQMLTGASIIAAFQESGANNPETAAEFRRMLRILADLEPVHQAILWSVYWMGTSMRGLAEEWGIDELSVIREHKEILEYLAERLASGQAGSAKRLKIRRGLRATALNLKKKKFEAPFDKFKDLAAMLLLLWNVARIGGLYCGSGLFEKYFG